jgi:Holliday junction DNA helicase RuvA
MIGRLEGRVERLDLDTLLVDCGGVGYEVSVPAGTAERLDLDEHRRGTIHIHTSVRDDAIDLYGFPSTAQKELFGELTGVSRVGPKTALRVLSDLTPSELVAAVRSNDKDDLTRVKGIGDKTAQRLILELKNSLDDFEFDELTPPEEDESDEKLEELHSALANWGYDDDTIEAVIEELDPDIGPDEEVEPLIREALELLR